VAQDYSEDKAKGMHVPFTVIEQDDLLIFILVAGGSLGWQVRGQMVGAFQVSPFTSLQEHQSNIILFLDPSGCCFCFGAIDRRKTETFTACQDPIWLSYHHG
jgi:hypothetical protein